MSTRAVTVDASAASEPISEFLPTDQQYRLTGELPADTREASAASTETKDEQHKQTEQGQPSDKGASAASTSDTAAASEAAKQQQEEKKQKNAASSESRWAKVTRENKELRERLERLEKGSTARETQQESQPATEAKTAASANTKPKIDDVDPKTGKPKYATYEEWQEAKDQWLLDEGARRVTENTSKSEREKAQQAQAREIAENLSKKFDASRAKHDDFDEVALNDDLVIPMGSVTHGFLIDSDHAGEVAYYLGQHPEILEGFYGDFDKATGKFTNKISPQRQFRKLMEIEAEVSGSSSHSESSSSSTAKPVTQATRPPHQTSGKGAVAKDAVEQAAEEGDTETYIREMNARDLARRKKGK